MPLYPYAYKRAVVLECTKKDPLSLETRPTGSFPTCFELHPQEEIESPNLKNAHLSLSETFLSHHAGCLCAYCTFHCCDKCFKNSKSSKCMYEKTQHKHSNALTSVLLSMLNKLRVQSLGRDEYQAGQSWHLQIDSD